MHVYVCKLRVIVKQDVQKLSVTQLDKWFIGYKESLLRYLTIDFFCAQSLAQRWLISFLMLSHPELNDN